MDAVLAELDESPDMEHPDVALSYESEWTLSVFENGLVVWENVAENDEPRHRRGVSRAEVRRLWQELAAGNLERVNAEEWIPGYG
ncbi:MAG: hypothetical protein ABR540_18615 [Acidimicrobiales bacterium]